MFGDQIYDLNILLSTINALSCTSSLWKSTSEGIPVDISGVDIADFICLIMIYVMRHFGVLDYVRI